MRTTLNLHPADGVRAFEDAYPAVAAAMGVDPASEEPVAFDPTDRRFLETYFADLHHPLEEQGVDFWWIDWQQGRTTSLPGVDPLWLLNHFHMLDSARDGGVGMTFLALHAGPGSHRYAVGFSGDAVVSWASPGLPARVHRDGREHRVRLVEPRHRRAHPRRPRRRAGHAVGAVRGVLAIMRLHSANNPFIRKEPWAFPAEARDAMGDALRFRHRLVPYLHTMNHRAAAGTALVRPLYHLEPHRDEAYGVPNEYAFGSELLVAPIVEPRDPESLLGRARAWLPPARGRTSSPARPTPGPPGRPAPRPRGHPGAPPRRRHPAARAEDEVDATVNPTSFEVLVAPGASGSFTLVEDREDDPASVCTTRLSWDADASVFRIEAAQGDPSSVPARRQWRVTFPRRARRRAAGGGATRGPLLGLPDGRHRCGAVLTLVGPPRVGVDARDGARRLLERAQSGNPEKLEAWTVVARDASRADRIAELQSVDLRSRSAPHRSSCWAASTPVRTDALPDGRRGAAPPRASRPVPRRPHDGRRAAAPPRASPSVDGTVRVRCALPHHEPVADGDEAAPRRPRRCGEQQVERGRGEGDRVRCDRGEARGQARRQPEAVPPDHRDVVRGLQPAQPHRAQCADRREVVAAEQPVDLETGVERRAEGGLRTGCVADHRAR